MESMTIACTRCGATCEGDIILPPIAFTFKHKTGCGHGVGPLAVLPGGGKKKSEKKKISEESKGSDIPVSDEHPINETPDVKEEIKVEEKVTEHKKKEKVLAGSSKKVAY